MLIKFSDLFYTLKTTKTFQFFKRFYRLFFILFFLVFSITWGIYKYFIEETSESIHIAIVGPMTDKDAANGKSYVQGVKLYLDQINKLGGIDGKRVVIDVYDDQNKDNLAKEMALKIVKDNKAVAIIGHNNSSCSIEGGKVYKEHQFPAVTPASTNPNVTKDNEWYFRTVFTDNLQAKFLAYYSQNVLKQNQFSIVSDSKKKILEDEFKASSQAAGSVFKYSWNMNPDNPDAEIDKIVQEIKNDKSDTGIIFLATVQANGSKFLKKLRDAELNKVVIGPDSFDSDSFREHVNKSIEKKNSGYYNDGLFVASPLIFDNANQLAQNFREQYRIAYNMDPDWRAAYAYDSIIVLVEALKKQNITGIKSRLKDERTKIKSYLASLRSVEESVVGVTGFNYFDKDRNPFKPVSIGVYKNNRAISALTQLQEVQDPSEIGTKENIQDELGKGTILKMDDKLLYKTNVVYTGIEINEINSLDVNKMTYNMDFYIWFRYQDGDLTPESIRFNNSLKIKENSEKKQNSSDPKVVPDVVNLPTVIVKPMEMKKEQELKIDNYIYKSFRVVGDFKSDGLPVKYTLGQQALGVSFQHQKLNRNRLIYVIDLIGMGLTNQANTEKQISDRTKEYKQILGTSSGFSFHNNWYFQDIATKSTLGDPKYLNSKDAKTDFSRFNVGIRIKKNEFSLNTVISLSTAKYMIYISGVIVIILGLISRFQKLKLYSNLIWFFQTVFVFILLQGTEIFMLDIFVQKEEPQNLRLAIQGFDMLWWVIPAIRITQSIERFIWVPLEIKTQHTIPTVLRRFVAFLVYLLTFFAIIAFVFGHQITSLLATSGVVAMIIGLAIQVNISNIFSGIAINMERPFRVGDWVKIGQLDEGKVIDITWRTTRVLTRNLLILSIPNSKASESAIQNFSLPDDIVEVWFTIHIDPAQPVKKVQKILLDALMSAEGVVKTPAPYTRLNEFTDWSADYIIGYCFKDYGKKNGVRKAVWNSVWTHLSRAGIAPAIQRHDVYIFKGPKPRGDEASKPITLLNEIDIFITFTDSEKLYLSQKMIKHSFLPGDIIVHAGDTNDSMYIIVEGVVTVMAPLENGNHVEVGTLGAGNFFGEMAMLTGAARTVDIVTATNTVLYEITKPDISPLLEKHPEIYNNVNKVVTQRKQSTETKKSLHQVAPPKPPETLYQKVRSSTMKFLGFKNEEDATKG